MYHNIGITGFRGRSFRGYGAFGEALEAGEDSAVIALRAANSDLSLSPEEYTYWYNYYAGMGTPLTGIASPDEYTALANDVVRSSNTVQTGNSDLSIAPSAYADAYNFLDSTGLGLIEAGWMTPTDYAVAYQQGANLGSDVVLPATDNQNVILPAAAATTASTTDVIAGGAVGGMGAGMLILAVIGAFLLFGNKRDR